MAVEQTHAKDVVLDVRYLTLTIATRRGVVRAVDDVSFTVRKGETLGLVGESGSGKSMTCLTLLGLIPRPHGRIEGGEVIFRGRDLRRMSARELRRVRGSAIGMILQDPLMSLNPAFRVGRQVGDPLKMHRGLRGGRLRNAVQSLLAAVGIPEPGRRAQGYPHQMSGGMRQRVVGAIAISCDPDLIIADEPTTALDVSVQTQYLQLLKDLQSRTGAGLVIVTHDLGIVATMCDSVAVMYAGRVIERASVETVFDDARHPYTIGLRNCLPSIDSMDERLPTIEGQPPDLSELPSGCSFAPRCPLATDRCLEQFPPEEEVAPSHWVSCWRSRDLAALAHLQGSRKTEETSHA